MVISDQTILASKLTYYELIFSIWGFLLCRNICSWVIWTQINPTTKGPLKLIFAIKGIVLGMSFIIWENYNINDVKSYFSFHYSLFCVRAETKWKYQFLSKFSWELEILVCITSDNRRFCSLTKWKTTL